MSRLETYVEPAKRWGWIAVAKEPALGSKWFLPPWHEVWRPTRRMAHAAIPKAVARLERDVRRREVGAAAEAERRSRRENPMSDDSTMGRNDGQEQS